jgi:hypothetical protein
MSRIRSIHPGFFTDEDLVSASMGARLLFLGLGIEADDKGIFEWKPLTIRMRVFPGDNVDVAAMLAELEGVGAIRRYEIGGKSYGAIRNFRKFQKPKTPNDIFPATAEMLAFVGLATETDVDEAPPFPPKGETFPPKGEKSPQMEDGGGKREYSVANATAAPAASDKQFWDAATAYLGGKRSLIGKWCKDYGKPETASAITTAQLERPVEPIAFIEATLRRNARAGPKIVAVGV